MSDGSFHALTENHASHIPLDPNRKVALITGK